MAKEEPSARYKHNFAFKKIKRGRGFTPLETKNHQVKEKFLTGFTLIELLIVTSIFALIMIGFYTAFHSGIFGYKSIDEALNNYQSGYRIMERINMDLKNSFTYSDTKTGFTGQNNSIGFFSLVDACYSLVSYRLDDDNKTLLRLCKKNSQAVNKETKVEPEIMTTNVQELSFSYVYLDAYGQERIKDYWDDPKALPFAVKVKLILKDTQKYEFKRKIFLSLS